LGLEGSARAEVVNTNAERRNSSARAHSRQTTRRFERSILSPDPHEWLQTSREMWPRHIVAAEREPPSLVECVRAGMRTTGCDLFSSSKRPISPRITNRGCEFYFRDYRLAVDLVADQGRDRVQRRPLGSAVENVQWTRRLHMRDPQRLRRHFAPSGLLLRGTH